METFELTSAGLDWQNTRCHLNSAGFLVIDSSVEDNLDSFNKLSKNDRLLLLNKMDYDSRSRLLRFLNGVERDNAIFGGDPALILDVQINDVGPEFTYDWASFCPTGFAKENLQGLMIMAKRAYEPQGADGSDPEGVGKGCADLVKNGFRIKFYGRETDKVRKSTQAYMAIKDDYAILTFRGSTFSPFNLEDFLADAFFLRSPGYFGRVHSGFAGALDEVWEELLADVGQLVQDGIKHLHITGHSLGASLSYLAARRLIDAVPEMHIASVVPFAAARVFNDEAAKSYSTRLGDVTWRVINTTDIVTMIPPKALGFRHPDSHIIYIDSDGLLRLDPTRAQIKADRDIANWDETRFLKSFRSTKYPSVAWLDPLRMHAPLAYLQPLYINREFLVLNDHEVLELIDKYLSFSTNSTHLEAVAQFFLPLKKEERNIVIKYIPKEYARPLLKWLTEEHIVLAVRHYLIATRQSESLESEFSAILSVVRRDLGRRVIKRTFSIFGSED